jgi:hypothetical protein
MGVKSRKYGDGFSGREDLALFDSRISRAHRATITAWNRRRSWTFEGNLEPIESLACEIVENRGAKAPAYLSDYSDKALRLIGLIRNDIEQGNAEAAARWALELGMVWREFQLKLGFEIAALGPSKGGRKAAANRWANADIKEVQNARLRAAFDAHRAEGLGKMAAYRLVAREFEISERSAQRRLRTS